MVQCPSEIIRVYLEIKAMMFVIIVIIPFATFPIRIHLFFLAETIAHFFETTTCTGRGRAASGNRSARTVRMALLKLNDVKHTADRRGRTVARNHPVPQPRS